ncbi:unnamed protein product, partial [Scytosiphon promiscuus]
DNDIRLYKSCALCSGQVPSSSDTPSTPLCPYLTSSRLLHDAACGISHMHRKGKVHRDIKAGNIVVVGGPEEETLAAKIADFGLT